MKLQKLRISVKAYEPTILDSTCVKILDVIKASGIEAVGPIPLPTKLRRYCVLTSPHVNKKSREHFELRIHKRIIDIVDPGAKTIDSLTRLNVPAGVDIKMRLD